ncbi:hypothetical protein F5I97DRAFT_1865690 [Phlebopus sp. FC_14]|nr:hypothetical protein F5I97DRAFT_1865690 [Phlebopus sp. FC_14]
MSGPKQALAPRHAAVVLAHDEPAASPEVVGVSKFALTWPAEPPPSVQTPLGHAVDRSVTLSSSEGESDFSEKELSSNEKPPPSELSDDYDMSPNHRLKFQQQLATHCNDGDPDIPRLLRTFSMPLPSQLEHLRNPCRNQGNPPALSILHTSSSVSSLRELSLELADSVQMVVQTLLQISPAQLLDPSKEHYSACSLSVPTSCMSAILTTMKNLNFMSANMSNLCVDAGSGWPTVGNDGSGQSSCTPITVSDFDIGELLQGVGDALSGCAAQLSIDLVLFHADVSLRHVAVLGEELALSITLTHVIRQIMNTAEAGDSIDVGLSIRSCSEGVSESPTTQNGQPNGGSPASEDKHVLCAFEITHHFRHSEGGSDTPTPSNSNLPFSRPDPIFDSPFLRRLFSRTGTSLNVGLPVRGNFHGRACEIAFRLQRGSSSVINGKTAPVSEYTSPLPGGSRIAKEPSLEELAHFSETLRGKKAMLHASANSSFAHHLTSYLTAWGLDVSHLSLESEADGNENVSPSSNGRGINVNSHAKPRQWSLVDSPHNSEHSNPQPNGAPRSSPPVSFVIIDDDVAVLRERMQKGRAEQPPLFAVHPRKRPSLASHHRPKSSPQVARAHGYGSTTPHSSASTLVYFTSLANYKTVKDVIQCDLATHAASLQPPVEVMIIPKPAGPRRFLTALHSAMTKPIVDPLFAPIATSPTSPGLQSSPFFNLGQPSPKSPSSRPANSARSNSERSVKTPREGDSQGLHPPSPLAISDTAEYFPDSVKLGASAASGLVIPGPDGQPTGIVFQPRAKAKMAGVGSSGEVQKAQFLVPTSDMLRTPATRRSSHGEDRNTTQLPLPFAALHSSAVATGTLSIRQDAAVGPDSQMPTTTKGKIKGPSVLADDATVTSPGASSRKGSPVDARKGTASPPVSPSSADPPSNAVPRRQPKRAALDQKPSTPPAVPNKAGKAVTDTNIIPPISVLIVDDNPINQTILSTFMRKKKIKYDVAKNGEEAVQKWRSGGFHLILMDIQMPVMDGIQATKEIRQLESLSAAAYSPSTPQSDGSVRTPSDAPSSESRTSASQYRSSVIIVALTASSLQSDRVAALAAGCNDFLTKPVSLQWLNNKIIEWGSIKALQMWADLRPEVAKTISTEQTAQAQMVARRLHVPEGRTTPIQSPSRSSSMGRPEVPGEAVPVVALEKLEALARRGEDPTPVMPSSFSRARNNNQEADTVGASSGLANVGQSDMEQSSSGGQPTADSSLVSLGTKEREKRTCGGSADDLPSASAGADHAPRTP